MLVAVNPWRGRALRALACACAGSAARGGVFAAIRERRELFEQARVNPDPQTIEWPGEVDLDPDVLYGRFEAASGVTLKRRIVRAPKTTFE